MKAFIVAAILAASTTAALAQSYGSSRSYGGYGTGSNPNSHYVAPHFNSSGSYTQGHQRTNPNSTQMDNYSTRGNQNPYTGQYGTRSPRY